MNQRTRIDVRTQPASKRRNEHPYDGLGLALFFAGMIALMSIVFGAITPEGIDWGDVALAAWWGGIGYGMGWITGGGADG